MDHNKIQLARVAMHGRILRCPLESNPEDCLLCEIRKMPIENRISWLESKSDQEVIDLFERHKDCLQRQLTKLALDP